MCTERIRMRGDQGDESTNNSGRSTNNNNSDASDRSGRRMCCDWKQRLDGMTKVMQVRQNVVS